MLIFVLELVKVKTRNQTVWTRLNPVNKILSAIFENECMFSGRPRDLSSLGQRKIMALSIANGLSLRAVKCVNFLVGHSIYDQSRMSVE